MSAPPTHHFALAPRLPEFIQDALPWHRRMLRLPGHALHFVDEGAGTPVMLLHGNPTWSFLWRKVIARLVPEGLRVIAPDLVGFGLSDKPTQVSAYSLAMELETVLALVDALDLRNLVLVGQDWGGPIAAGVARARPERLRGLVLANTSVLPPARPFRPKAFHRFSHAPMVSDLAFRGLGLPMHLLELAQGKRSRFERATRRAYVWPFRRSWQRAGPLALARMVPTSEAHPSTALLDAIGGWMVGYRGPTELVWGLRDPILGRALGRHRRALPQARVTETQAGHFLQEQVPEELARAILRVVTE
ncbi:MAG: alpha/beta fold hydrolase [Deltaproteobacteria bacterium]|nr:alpha/beta fold hydrolase [Deltaproteobacteria bacterium]